MPSFMLYCVTVNSQKGQPRFVVDVCYVANAEVISVKSCMTFQSTIEYHSIGVSLCKHLVLPVTTLKIYLCCMMTKNFKYR